MEGRHRKGNMSSGFWRRFALTMNGCEDSAYWKGKGLVEFRSFVSSNCAIVFWNDELLKIWYLEIPENFPAPHYPSLSEILLKWRWVPNSDKNNCQLMGANFYSVSTKFQALLDIILKFHTILWE